MQDESSIIYYLHVMSLGLLMAMHISLSPCPLGLQF